MDVHIRVLGLKGKVTASDVKRAYHSLALQHHPDRNAAPGAADTFKRIQAAYEFVSKNYQSYTFGAPVMDCDTLVPSTASTSSASTARSAAMSSFRQHHHQTTTTTDSHQPLYSESELFADCFARGPKPGAFGDFGQRPRNSTDPAGRFRRSAHQPPSTSTSDASSPPGGAPSAAGDTMESLAAAKAHAEAVKLARQEAKRNGTYYSTNKEPPTPTTGGSTKPSAPPLPPNISGYQPFQSADMMDEYFAQLRDYERMTKVAQSFHARTSMYRRPSPPASPPSEEEEKTPRREVTVGGGDGVGRRDLD